MKYKNIRHLILAGLACLLCSCGPKDIGEGTSAEYYSSAAREPSTSTADHARYPADGNRVQQRLFLLNQPAVQIQLQDRQRNFMNKRMGITPEAVDPATTPKQPSPFREF